MHVAEHYHFSRRLLLRLFRADGGGDIRNEMGSLAAVAKIERRSGSAFLRPGSFVLVEDTHGKGHISRHSAEAQTIIWIALPNGLDLPSG